MKFENTHTQIFGIEILLASPLLNFNTPHVACLSSLVYKNKIITSFNNQHFLKDTRRLKTRDGRQNHSVSEVKLLRQIRHKAKT
jgi:hypothetical protein